MLSRSNRMSGSEVRHLFRQEFQKIHARHLGARVFFLPQQSHGPHFGVLLPRGSYTNSPDMHRKRRLVYAALETHLAQIRNAGRLQAVLCAVMPRDSFFALAPAERSAAALELLEIVFPSSHALA